LENKLTLEDAIAKIAELEAQIKQEREGAAAIFAELHDKVKLQEKINPNALPVVVIGKDQYQFTAGKFRYNGKIIEAKEAASDKALLKELLEKGFGGFQKIVD
jgi:hypothetical protein